MSTNLLVKTDLSSLRIPAGSVPPFSPGPWPDKPNASDALARVEQARQWCTHHPSLRRRIDNLILDVDGTMCRWIHAPSAAPPVVAAQVRSLTEQWSSVAPVGSVEALVDPATEQRRKGMLATLRDRAKVRAEREGRSAGGQPPRAPGQASTQFFAVIDCPDAMVRLLADRLDATGVRIGCAMTLWHAAAAVWSNDDSPLHAVLLIDGEERIVWAFSKGQSLLAGGQIRLESLATPINPDSRPAGGAESTPEDPTSRTTPGEAALRRLSLDWISWSSHLGASPTTATIVANQGSAIARDLSAGLAKQWPGAQLTHISDDDPIGTTVTKTTTPTPQGVHRAGGPRRSLTRLSERPTRAAKRRYRVTAFALVAAAVAVAGVARGLSAKGAEWKAQATAIQIETNQMVEAEFPTRTPGVPLIAFLANELKKVREQEWIEPPPPKPIFEEIRNAIAFFQETLGEIRIREIAFALSDSGVTLELMNVPGSEIPSLTAALEAEDRNPTLAVQWKYSPRSGTTVDREQNIRFNGEWRDAP